MSWDMFGGAAAPEADQGYRSREFPPAPDFPMPMPGGHGYNLEPPPAPYMPIGAPVPRPPPLGASSYSPSPWGFDNAPPPPPPSAPPAFAAPRGPVTVDISYSGHSSHSYTSHQHTHSTPHNTHTHSAPHITRPASAAPRPVQATPSAAQSSHSLGNVLSHFQYSKCTGKRKAVCIGINYRGQPYELFGCVNDAKNVYRFLNRHHHYKEQDIILLVDDSKNPRQQPTKKNILDAMRWLVKDAKPNDSLFFHYSGHGGQVKDRDGDELDGWDEVIYPLDYQTAGSIVDDLMHAIMVKPLPTGCRLTALFDSCHSGSILDLPYLYHTNGRTKGSQVKSSHIKAKATPADVISWSGCKDSQKSADTFEGGAAAGAMSYAFMTSLTMNPHQSYQELLRSVREILKKKYSQRPQLSSSHRIDTNLQFIL
ncbi:caspase domain-containing protein [Cristinia sonorae]|uniref:Caspase domain-containing protein n=1 Tax=Cristinia sonorae TaxID=1940300 RepID=A0A8K0UKL8_9AGAR|nr:caspase domain-containing protein [Cristinia sonorae]